MANNLIIFYLYYESIFNNEQKLTLVIVNRSLQTHGAHQEGLQLMATSSALVAGWMEQEVLDTSIYAKIVTIGISQTRWQNQDGIYWTILSLIS